MRNQALEVARSLEQVLQSTADVLYPGVLGEAQVSIDSAGCDGDTPLHALIWRIDTAGALLRIAHGAAIDGVADTGETPLHVAIAMKNEVFVRALLAAGARTDIVCEFGLSAAAKTAQHGFALGHSP